MATELPGRAIEIQGAPTALLDEPFLLRARGAGSDAGLVWRARLRDDDDRVWRASAPSAEELPATWAPAKATTGPLAALQSLRPVRVDVRVEAPDGRGAARTFTRLLVGEGVRVRRWRDGLAAALFLPAAEQPCAAVVLDATAGPEAAAVAALAAPLLASRGVLALAVPPPPAGRGADDGDGGGAIATARERLAAIPAAAAAGVIEVLTVLAVDAASAADGPTVPAGHVVSLPPGIPSRAAAEEDRAARAAAWDALLAALGARARTLAADA